MGIEPISFLVDWWFVSICRFGYMAKGVGWFNYIFGGNISYRFTNYEVAIIDGAGRFRKIASIFYQ